MKLSDIKIGTRYRVDCGDIKGLADNINEIGLLHPIVINENKELICGFRRLMALDELGLQDLEEDEHYRVVNLKDILLGEYSENVYRKQFTPSEAVAIWDATESYQGLRSESKQSSRRIERVAKSLGVGKNWLSEAKQVIESGNDELIDKIDSGRLAVHSAYKRVKKDERLQKMRNKAKDYNPSDDDIEVICGDFHEVCKDIPDNSIDMILTDPPYPKEYLELWKDLGTVAYRVLKPSSYCIAYSGHIWLPEVINSMLETGLEYYWIFCHSHIGGTTDLVNARKLIAEWKPILVFCKPPLDTANHRITGDMVRSPKPEKDLHEWQQSEFGSEFFISFFSEPGDLVLEPMAGAGTVPSVCKKMKRKCIAIEIEEENVEIIKGRLSSM